MYQSISAIKRLSVQIFCIFLLSQTAVLAQGLTNSYRSPSENQIENARLLYNDLKLESAYKAYNSMLQEYPDNGEVLFGMAITTEAMRDYDQALIYYNLLVHYDFELPEIYMNRGKIRYKKEPFEDALEEFIIGEKDGNLLKAVNLSLRILIHPKIGKMSLKNGKLNHY